MARITTRLLFGIQQGEEPPMLAHGLAYEMLHRGRRRTLRQCSLRQCCQRGVERCTSRKPGLIGQSSGRLSR